MDNNDSNIKSQQTGGLKLMTVFIAVLALHVVVIGGFTVYHLMSGGTNDADLTTTDKNHKSLNGSSTTDGTTADAGQNDKSTSTPTPPTEVATIPASTVTPASVPAPTGDTVSPSVASASATTPAASSATEASPSAVAPASTPSPAPAVTSVEPTPAAVPPPANTAQTPSAQTPTGPISPDLAPPAEPTPGAAEPMAPEVAPAASLATGPVHMPPANRDASRVDRMHEQIYVVKITDSYKKIAHRHHITVAQLKEANHIRGDVLHTGQKLFIPSERSEVAENAPTSTLSSIPTASVVSESVAPMTTGLTSSSTPVATTGLHHHFYTVVKGDTLTKIAHRFRTTPSAIMAENGITDPTKLSIGKKLRIPSRESRSASNGAPASTPPSQVQAKGNGNAPTAQLANYAQ